MRYTVFMHERNGHELFKRYIFFLLGLCLNATGIALFTHSNLGTGPTSCIPYVISLKCEGTALPLSFGTCTFLFNLLLLIIQVLILGKKFPKYQFLQLPVTLLFSVFIDGAMNIVSFIKVETYAAALFLSISGCVFRALGVSFQVVADVVMLSTEAFVKSVSDISKKEFSIIKILFDFIMAAIAILLSFLLLGRLESVREGTIIIVVLVGPLSHIFTKRLDFTNYVFKNETELVVEPKFKINKDKRIIITVTSESGSGGRVIAKILGVKLGLSVYDKNLIGLIAKEGGFTEKFVSDHNEVLYRSTAEAFIYNNYIQEEFHSKSYRKLYDAQERVIKNLAAKENCIITGHCSNYILKDDENALHILITADMEHRITYISEKYNLTKRDAQKKIKKQDKNTAEFYMHFTESDWKSSNNYHLCIDSSLFGYEGTALTIEDIIKRNYGEISSIKLKDLLTKYKI